MRYPSNLVPNDYTIKHWVLNHSGIRKIHVCAISNIRGEVVGIGHAICNPTDKYSPTRGKEIAQGRAIKEWSGHKGMRSVAPPELNEEIYIPPLNWDAFDRFG
jgi:hypothetical protein